jgi:hypothetical protein
MASTQLVIQCSPGGFTQQLADSGSSTTKWKFPVVYTTATSQDAEVAEITIDSDPPTTLVTGTQGQTVSGSGSTVVLSVELGDCEGVKITANPNTVPDCTPFISSFSGEDSSFQIDCSSQTTTWNLTVTLEVIVDKEFAPPSVSLMVDGAETQTLPDGGPTSLSPKGSTIGFIIANLQGNSKITISYTLD